MPTPCEPWPGNRNANFVIGSMINVKRMSCRTGPLRVGRVTFVTCVPGGGWDVGAGASRWSGGRLFSCYLLDA